MFPIVNAFGTSDKVSIVFCMCGSYRLRARPSGLFGFTSCRLIGREYAKCKEVIVGNSTVEIIVLLRFEKTPVAAVRRKNVAIRFTTG